MNNDILQLEKLSQAFLESIQQLADKDKLSNIERDHLKQQCIVIYDHILSLTAAIAEDKTKPEPPALVIESEPEDKAITPIPPKTESIQPALFTEMPLIEEIEKPAEPVETRSPIKTETEIQNNRIDSILESQQKINKPESHEAELSLHEKLLHNMAPKENIIEKLVTAIPSLKNAINVNLKIAFVHQLFNDNTVEYVKAIDKLNSCENIHEAMRYFNELKHSYSWDSEHANVKELEQLLHKRYGG
jgi:hypothetical protein